MFCKYCGQENAPSVSYCSNCGKPLTENEAQIAAMPKQDENYLSEEDIPAKGMGIASMVLGIVSLVIPPFSIICGIIGLIMGNMAKHRAEEENKTNNYAKAGAICSTISLCIFGAIILLSIIYAVYMLLLGGVIAGISGIL